MREFPEDAARYPGPDKDDEQELTKSAMRKAAREFMQMCGMEPTADSISQMTEVFIPCLRIMCERPWDPRGGTWRAAGRLGALADLKKKFDRVWYRYWLCNKPHIDSILDLINYAGFALRSEDDRWGSWGEPGSVDTD